MKERRWIEGLGGKSKCGMGWVYLWKLIQAATVTMLSWVSFRDDSFACTPSSEKPDIAIYVCFLLGLCEGVLLVHAELGS